MTFHTPQLITLCASSVASASALAHQGHGFSGAHWHVSDAAGLAALGVLIALTVWLSKR